MTTFFKLILKIIIIIFLAGIVLDLVYSKVLSTSKYRNKIEFVMNSKKLNYDVIILGSSRANNHFVAEMFEHKGLKTFNYGISASHLFEADLLLKLMEERQFKIKTIIIEVDLNLANEHRDEGISSRFMPFLHQSTLIKKHYENESDFKALYYIPFYRYIKFDNKIGFRETYNSAIKDSTVYLAHNGYYPLYNSKKGNMKNNYTKLNPLKNKYYEDIKKICKRNGIQLISVMTPICSNVKGIDYLDKVQKLYPEIHNYENVVTDDNLFSSCGHLNDEGARIFTSRIIHDFFNKSSN
ncbi:hypothetical protein B0A58_06960 [Flavobacterium branchiophilum NBRC 15030 = ATCC 35035]|uniref:SGNH/GDSL hydrolase family protein n=2 Tax=Flavobacterium branchiophilum TaxID=55197 RepID=A0A543G8P1_9FLAO|nr:hypothetical protein [Flavobacterium branchiophilum]OXA76772.1 hypothetical protein B0A58_06960 [Flavobacterium branchiophilum NBRC 15030 = ATCC 35035]TQM42455.1 hypothetical protein BC670_3518 [Flavobacterium branchiophilum]GEM54153.1 hypothetical protein FB1_03740 [Flavobacterium branchiophilum NBRC 15030 = ATCC 35035]